MNGKSDLTHTLAWPADVKIMKLKNNLREILSRKGMSAAELARVSKVPKTTISDWLAGSSPKNLQQVKTVADILNLSVDELVFGASPTNSRKSVLEEYTENEIYAGHYEVILRRIIK